MTPGSDAPHAHRARKRPAWTARPGGHEPRARCPRSSLVLGVLVLAAVVSTRWVRVNVSPSTPLGLYRLAPLTLPLPRGTLVLLPVPARVQAWHGKTMPLVKPVAAIAGDTVCVQESSLWIEGARYGPVWREAHGTLLPQWTLSFRQACLTSHHGSVKADLACHRPILDPP